MATEPALHPALIEVWQQPDSESVFLWRTRRRGFRFELFFQQLPPEADYGEQLYTALPEPSLTCRKRVELDAIYQHYQQQLLEKGFKRVYSHFKGGRIKTIPPQL